MEQDDEFKFDPKVFEELKGIVSKNKIHFITPKAYKLPTGLSAFNKVLEGGFKPSDFAVFLGFNPSQGKSDIVGYIYRRKAVEKADLEAFIEKGEGTATELEEARQKVAELTRQLNQYFMKQCSDIGEMGLVVSIDMDVGMRGFIGRDGLLEIDSFNLISPMPEPVERMIINGVRRKPALTMALLQASILNHNNVICEAPFSKKKEADWKPDISRCKPIKDNSKKKTPPSKLLLSLIGKTKDTS